MRADTADVVQLWIDIEDRLIPFLKLDAHLRAVYYHLVRRSRLLGQRTVEISIDSLAQATGLSAEVRQHIRTLESKGAVRILSRQVRLSRFTLRRKLRVVLKLRRRQILLILRRTIFT